MGGSVDRQLVLALEMVKEAAFGHADFSADGINRCRGIALTADDVQGRSEQFGFLLMLCPRSYEYDLHTD